MRSERPSHIHFGGKSKVVNHVWPRFGDVRNYVEPFGGSAAMLLGAPEDPRRVETINEINPWLLNFWRAVQADPDAVAYHADQPVAELDLHAWGDWMFYKSPAIPEFIEKMRGDPKFYDAEWAGRWAWGQSCWIGDNWGRMECRARPLLDGDGHGPINHGVIAISHVERKRPNLAGQGGDGRPHFGVGVNAVARQMPLISGQGGQSRPRYGCGVEGIARQMPECSTDRGVQAYMRRLAHRLRHVRMLCGDWKRVVTPSVTTSHGLTAVFLDPPYAVSDRSTCYGENDSLTVGPEVVAWCLENGTNPLLRIAYCGYDTEGAPLVAAGWSALAWKTQGGYGNQRKGDRARTNENGSRERIWFSPHCLPPIQSDMFAEAPE